MEIRYHTTCLLCGGKNIKPLKGYEKHDLLKCSECSFVFMRRIPTDEELDSYYSDYGYDDDNIPEPTRTSLNDLVDTFGQYRRNNKILDVGCGEGWMLEIAKMKGWEVYGTELSSRSIEICKTKGIKIYAGVLNPEKMDVGEFDIVVSSQTFEHINNPNEEISNINKLLRKGGLFYITTPNFNSYLRFILKEKYDIIVYPEHLTYYTKRTLNKLLKQNGFKKIKLMTFGISLTHFQNSVGEGKPKIKKSMTADERLRKRIANSLWLQFIKKKVNSVLTYLGVGMTLKGYYTKK